jgi:subtilisin family serine protease
VKYGVAKKAQLVSVRVLDCSGSGYNSDVLSGVEWAIRDRLGGVSFVAVVFS